MPCLPRVIHSKSTAFIPFRSISGIVGAGVFPWRVLETPAWEAGNPQMSSL